MIKKNTQWNQREKQQKTFEELKERFMIEPILVTLDLDEEMRAEANMSDFAIDGVLSMKYENEKQRIVTYILKLLNEIMKFTIKRYQ